MVRTFLSPVSSPGTNPRFYIHLGEGSQQPAASEACGVNELKGV